MTWELIWEHLFIVLSSAVLSIIIGLPLGILAYAFPKVRGVILRAVDVLQTIPTLALLGIIMVFAGAGKGTVIIGITLYSLLPVVRSTCLGLSQVDSGIKEAATGCGMSGAGRLFTVELPLAFPTIFTGIRIAVVNAIGTAVFAAFVGGGGLGSVLTRGVRVQDMRLVLTGTGTLMAIAAVLDLLMGWFEGQVSKKRGRGRKMLLGAAVLCVMLLAVMPLGLADSAGEDEMVLYDGDYSETQIMHRIVKYLVEDRTDLHVAIKDQMSQVNNFKALTAASPTCDLMVSYDGTLLTTFLHLDPEDVPEGMALYDFANERAAQEYGVRLLGQLGFDNTYAVAVPESVAQRYSLRCVSDLVPVAGELTFGAEHEFFTQEGSMKYGPFTQFYGLSFRDAVSVDASLKYAAIEGGSFDVTEVYATDGLNRKAGLRVLEDDLGFFPDYNGALLVRDGVFEKFASAAPELEGVLALLDGMISNENMVDMTYRVDVLGESADNVARDFLKSAGLMEN